MSGSSRHRGYNTEKEKSPSSNNTYILVDKMVIDEQTRYLTTSDKIIAIKQGDVIGNDRISPFVLWYQWRPPKTRITRSLDSDRGKSHSGRGDFWDKDPEIGTSMACLKDRKNLRVPGGPWASGRMAQDAFEEVIRIQVTKDLVSVKLRFYSNWMRSLGKGIKGDMVKKMGYDSSCNFYSFSYNLFIEVCWSIIWIFLITS